MEPTQTLATECKLWNAAEQSSIRCMHVEGQVAEDRLASHNCACSVAMKLAHACDATEDPTSNQVFNGLAGQGGLSGSDVGILTIKQN
eukprot:6465371-Amphidinium_carterae.2